MTYNKYTYEETNTDGLLYCAELDRFAALDNEGDICACGSKDDCIEELALNVQ